MHKTNNLLFLLSVLALASIFIGGVALAAEVTKVHTNKGQITIDQGKNDGYVMGAEVCFYSFSGEQITCGQVRQTSESSATVKVNNREAKKIKQGMEAILMVPKPSVKTD